jgi:hypothetical protein
MSIGIYPIAQPDPSLIGCKKEQVFFFYLGDNKCNKKTNGD